MSALGHKRTSQHVRAMSALPPIADIAKHCWDVGFVPKADKVQCIKNSLAIRSHLGAVARLPHALGCCAHVHHALHKASQRIRRRLSHLRATTGWIDFAW